MVPACGKIRLDGQCAPVGRFGARQLIGGTVRLTPILEDGTKDKPFELVLSPDGKKLGTMVKL